MHEKSVLVVFLPKGVVLYVEMLGSFAYFVKSDGRRKSHCVSHPMLARLRTLVQWCTAWRSNVQKRRVWIDATVSQSAIVNMDTGQQTRLSLCLSPWGARRVLRKTKKNR